MKPDPRFVNQPKHFWANVRSISQYVGYTARGTGKIRVPDLGAIVAALDALGLGTTHVVDGDGRPTELGASLAAYFAYRADALNRLVAPRLMDAAQAAKAFGRVRKLTKSKLPVPMNKQKGTRGSPPT